MTANVERMLPLYEGKMGNQFDHRSARFVGDGDTDIEPNEDHSQHAVVLPRKWVREELALERQARRQWGTKNAMLGFRRVARNTDERTTIATFIPFGAASYGWILTAGPNAESLAILAGQYNSFVHDYVIRQFLSQPSVPQGTFAQLPTVQLDGQALESAIRPLDQWIVDRVAEVGATGDELLRLSEELCPSTTQAAWDRVRRELIRVELDAAYFHLYGIERDDVDYIMETFPIVQRKDIAAHGEFRTKRLILEVFDAMQHAIDTGTEYHTILDPPPGQGERHPAKES